MTRVSPGLKTPLDYSRMPVAGRSAGLIRLHHRCVEGIEEDCYNRGVSSANNAFPRPIGTQRAVATNPGQVAQLVERSPEKAGVGGSIPSLATILSITYKQGKPRACSEMFQKSRRTGSCLGSRMTNSLELVVFQPEVWRTKRVWPPYWAAVDAFNFDKIAESNRYMFIQCKIH